MDPTPKAEKELQRLTRKAEAIAKGMAQHGIPMEANVQVHDDQSVHAQIKLGGEGWLAVLEMLVIYLDNKELVRQANEAREAGRLPVSPGPEGFQ